MVVVRISCCEGRPRRVSTADTLSAIMRVDFMPPG